MLMFVSTMVFIFTKLFSMMNSKNHINELRWIHIDKMNLKIGFTLNENEPFYFNIINKQKNHIIFRQVNKIGSHCL